MAKFKTGDKVRYGGVEGTIRKVVNEASYEFAVNDHTLITPVFESELTKVYSPGDKPTAHSGMSDAID